MTSCLLSAFWATKYQFSQSTRSNFSHFPRTSPSKYPFKTHRQQRFFPAFKDLSDEYSFDPAYYIDPSTSTESFQGPTFPRIPQLIQATQYSTSNSTTASSAKSSATSPSSDRPSKSRIERGIIRWWHYVWMMRKLYGCGYVCFEEDFYAWAGGD